MSHQESSGGGPYLGSHQESSGVVRSHQESSGVIRSRQESSGVIRRRAYLGSHQESSGVIRRERTCEVPQRRTSSEAKIEGSSSFTPSSAKSRSTHGHRWSTCSLVKRSRPSSTCVLTASQRQSEAITGHQRPSEAIISTQKQSEAIRGHQRPSEEHSARRSPQARDSLSLHVRAQRALCVAAAVASV
jgi:hypothetical protein